jgi:hypothetical protein
MARTASSRMPAVVTLIPSGSGGGAAADEHPEDHQPERTFWKVAGSMVR